MGCPIELRLSGFVSIDGFRFFDLTKRPATNVVWSGQANFYRRIIVDAVVGAFANAHLPNLLRWECVCSRDANAPRRRATRLQNRFPHGLELLLSVVCPVIL